MEFGVDKCATLNLTKGKHSSRNVQIDHTTFFKELDKNENYKYLRIIENETIDHKQMRQTVAKEYYSRCRKILKTILIPKNSDLPVFYPNCTKYI